MGKTTNTGLDERGHSSHFALDREVELRVLNPSTSSGGSALTTEQSQRSAGIHKLVSKKKIVSPTKASRRKETKTAHIKKKIHIPKSPLRISFPQKAKNHQSNSTSPPKPHSSSFRTSKPWRANMKYQKANQESQQPPEESCKIHRKASRNPDEVKMYMKEKSNKQREESLKERKMSYMRKETIKNRLEDLELRRKEKMSQLSPKKNYCPIHGYKREPQVSKVTSEPPKITLPKRSTLETLKEVQRNKINHQLFRKLEKLTKELDLKRASSLSQGPLDGSKKLSLKELLPSESPSREEKKVLDNFIERKVTVDRTTSPIQSLITKHEKDIDYVKNMDSNLLPPSLKSDNFNFISTVKRKMNIEAGSRAMLSFKGGMPLTGDKQISISSKTEDTVSEGPISTSLASYNSKESSSIKRSQSSENPRNVSGEEDVGSSNVESNKSYVSKSSMNTMETSENHSNRNAEFVPSALHLRFLAELNQLENVQSTEKHVDKLDRIRDLSVVRQDAATMASIIKGLHDSKTRGKYKSEKSSKRESRAEFESRIRSEFNALFKGTIQPLIESQAEATRVTAESTKMFLSIHKNILETNDAKNTQGKTLIDRPPESLKSLSKGSESIAVVSNPGSSEGSRNTIPEEVISLISKTESSIPEVLSVLEKASQSGNSIRQTISEVMSRRNEDDSPSSCSSVTINTVNITEEIENEMLLSSPGDPLSSTPTRIQQQSGDYSSEFTLNMIEQHIQVESSRASNQYLRLKLKEKKIVERAKTEMSLLDAEKRVLKSKGQDTSQISERMRSIVATVTSQRKEIKALKEKLKTAERERQAVLRRQRALLRDRKKVVVSDPDTSQSTLVPGEEEEGEENPLTLSSKGLNLPADFSPKVSNKRLNESSEDSLANISQSSDHSDAAIRVNALKDELQKQKTMAKKLRDQQKIQKQENLKAQSESLKKQIETYDRLIHRTREEINHSDSSFEVVPPQIKTPGSKSRSDESEGRTTLAEEHDFTDCKTSASETEIETDIVSSADSSSHSSSKASTVIPDTHVQQETPNEKGIEGVTSLLFKSLMTDTAKEYKHLKVDHVEEGASPLVKSGLEGSNDPYLKGFYRPQDLMLTTFDVDTEECPKSEEPHSCSVFDDDECNGLEEEKGNPENDFIDDDFGLSTIKKESEELHNQQMRIEEEINRIQEESSTGGDKPPPPPYSMKPSTLRRVPAISLVPSHLISSPENLKNIIPQMLNYLKKNDNEASDKKTLFLEGLLGNLKEKSLYEEPTQFLEALFDTLEESQMNSGKVTQNPPWMKQKPLTHLRGPQTLQVALTKEALCLFGREKKSAKEALVLRSFRKKRSTVENLLAHELIGEKDEEWNGYNEAELALKDNLTSSILNNLIKDTVSEIKRL